ncbi:DNA mismatch repair protein MutS [Asticcacaulis biprosthecium C19]|uniref:DNA mismatch repair protein MutS n=1 Tax=Asticcacaulis biprosthecium C19 TaxID=715226 RepID=F4QK34_9CAUL|nr:DNA mismatch repair protein MutS [Asticcacaulis biprosthecium]EGF92061.1 DNA mismatch repair protein MutS [Asticcacaulis biprosthecium C19]
MNAQVPIDSPKDATDFADATPVMAQYLKTKQEHPDALLLFRMGDFYEIFFDDAVVASQALSLALTKRGVYQGKDIPLAGVPAHALDAYVSKLIRLGFRVAVCDQLEDPAEAKKRGSKSVVKRGVVRVVTPGTLTEDTLLEDRGANRLIALSSRGGVMAIASVELSTGDVECLEIEPETLSSHLSALRPSETLVADRLLQDEAVFGLLKQYGGVLQPQPSSLSDPSAGEQRLLYLYGVATLDGFGSFSASEMSALGMLAAYIDVTQAGKRPVLKPPAKVISHNHLAIDAATRNSLEIDRTQQGKREGSLIAALDMTVTSGGGRLLAARLARPLFQPDAINARLDTVAWLLPRRDARNDLRHLMRSLSDQVRALSRLSLNRGGPRDLTVIQNGLTVGETLAATLNDAAHDGIDPVLPAEIDSVITALIPSPPVAALRARLERALVEEPALSLKDGGFIRAGYSAELDEMRGLRDDSRQIVLNLEQRLAAETGIAIRIKFNNVLGYFIELSQKLAEQLVAQDTAKQFIHRQSLANQVRFVTTELVDLDSRIQRAAASALGLEMELFETLRDEVRSVAPQIQAAHDAICALDVACANACWAEEFDATRPVIDDTQRLEISRGRHPVVCAVLKSQGKPFTPNDVALDAEGAISARLSLVTGPNMAGKSTFLRQNALLIVMSQAGLFVPAKAMHLGVVDRLFSRVGAGDDLAQGRSTFMMEMVETAAILQQATTRSFVILDEIGRGTATYDGLAIAWACAEDLHDRIQCRALFATHYHEMAVLDKRLKALSNLSLQAREHNGELIFLHEVRAGSADRSYGVQVARLAGMPGGVVTRARDILTRLEEDNQTKLRLDDLPLFSHTRAPAPVSREHSKAETLLKSLNPDDLSPKEALEVIYNLHKLVKTDG